MKVDVIVSDNVKRAVRHLKITPETFQEMLEADNVHNMPWRIGRLQDKLSELSGEIERVIRESFKKL